MSTSTSTIRRLSALLVVAGLGATGCEAIDPTSNCRVAYNNVAADPANRFSVTHQIPQYCPLGIVTAGERTSYLAKVRAKALIVGTDLTLHVTSALGLTVGQNTALFRPDANDGTLALAEQDGYYFAGSVQPGFGETLADTAHNTTTANGQDADGYVFLTYRYASLAVFYYNQGSVVGESYSQEIALTPLANPVGTVSYEWFRDGASLGPSSPDAAAVSTVFNSSGTHTLDVVATDGTGASARWSSQVEVSYPGGCDQEPCDRRPGGG